MSSVVPAHLNTSLLRVVLAAKLPDLSTSPSFSSEAFLESMLRWLQDWFYSKDPEFAAAAPFALAQLNEDPVPSGFKRLRFFREEGSNYLLNGSNIVMTQTQMTLGHLFQFPATTLEGLGDQITTLGLNTHPTVLVHPAQKLIIFCPAGIDQPRAVIKFEESLIQDLTLPVLDDLLTKFDQDYTRYPEGYATIWVDKKEFIVYRQAEENIQNHLLLFLKSKFDKTHFVLREHKLPVGRADIAVLDPRTMATPCVIELKVFRDKGLPRKWDGAKKLVVYPEKKMRFYAWRAVGQTLRYKDALQTPLAVLCCFDARKEECKFTDVEQLAIQKGIQYRQFRVHSSTAAADDSAAGIK